VLVQSGYQIAGRRSTEIAASIELGASRGRLAPGQSLPTVRGLALELGVSLGTVAAAYRRLQSRGIIVSAGRRGTRVRAAPPALRSVPRIEVPRGLADLADGNPHPRFLPTLTRALRSISREPVLYGGVAHDEELLALAQRSFKRDGIACGDVAIVHGALDGIERALTAQLRAGDRVAVEDPVYPVHLNLLAALGLQAEPVALDEHGMRPDALDRAVRKGARAMIASPRAQNPTGAALDARRRQALWKVLDRCPELFVVEDDHGWLVAGAPYRTLASGRRRGLVARSFSKAFGPDLRVGFVAGDPITIARLTSRQPPGAGWVSHISQSIARDLWSDPKVVAGITTASKVYADRRHALVAALARERITLRAPSGLTCWIEVRDEAATVTALRDAGFCVAPGEAFRIAAGPAIRVTTARLDIADAPALARVIAATEHDRPAARLA